MPCGRISCEHVGELVLVDLVEAGRRRESCTVDTIIATIAITITTQSPTPCADTVSSSMVTPTIAATIGSTTVNVGSDAVSDPGLKKARWLSTKPSPPISNSAYGTQCERAPMPWSPKAPRSPW